MPCGSYWVGVLAVAACTHYTWRFCECYTVDLAAPVHVEPVNASIILHACMVLPVGALNPVDDPTPAGCFESGCFPGSFYHLSLFFTSLEVGFAYATVASSTALSNVIGAPMAAGILYMDGLGGLRVMADPALQRGPFGGCHCCLWHGRDTCVERRAGNGCSSLRVL